jgi:hypothetical protein
MSLQGADCARLLIRATKRRGAEPHRQSIAKNVQEILAQIRAAHTTVMRNPEILMPGDGRPVAPAPTADDKLPDTALAEIRAALVEKKDKLPTITASNTVGTPGYTFNPRHWG